MVGWLPGSANPVLFVRQGRVYMVVCVTSSLIYEVYIFSACGDWAPSDCHAAARLISLWRKHEHITLFCEIFTGFPYIIELRLKFYTSHTMLLTPLYIRDLLTPYIPSCRLRSSSKNLLVIPHYNLKTYGTWSFSVTAPTRWNTLPSDITNSS